MGGSDDPVPADELPCPCCGFLTLERYYGSYVICPVCDWEDDQVQLANPTSEGGANGPSLAQAQVEALAAHPLEQEFAHGFHRGPRWRPLNAGEIATADRAKAIRHWHRQGILAESDAYWCAASPADDRA